MERRFPIAVLMLTLLWGSGACSSYTDYTRDAQRAVADGDVKKATWHLNEHLEVDEFAGQPRELSDEITLLLLERATLLQAQGNYEAAARDMQVIDDHLEWMDLGSSTADDILSFTYSDDAGDYEAPPHERLLLNTMNMINFLALGQDQSARVEARRFTVMRDFYLDSEPDEIVTSILGLGNYMAGVAFEVGEEYRDAVRYYVEAYSFGVWPEADDERLLDLINLTGYDGRMLGARVDMVGDLFERANERPRVDRSTYETAHLAGDTLIIVQTGLVPYREAERIQIESALRRGKRARYSGRHLDDEILGGIDALQSSGRLNWLNTTSLSSEGLPSDRAASLTIEDTEFVLQYPINLTEQVKQEWEEIARLALAAGISRAVTRYVISEGVGRGVEAITGSSGWGRLVRLFTSVSLSIADTPDTRSWTSLPDDIHMVRMQLPEGVLQMEVNVEGRVEHRDVEVRKNGFQLFNFSRLR